MRARVDKSIIKYLIENQHNLIIAGESAIGRSRLLDYIKSVDTTKQYTIISADKALTGREHIIKELDMKLDVHREPVVGVAKNLRMNIRDVKKKFEMLIDCQLKANGEHYYLVYLY